MAIKYFARTDLAALYVQKLAHPTMASSSPGGLFLTAPRRTGKSWFIQRDLVPTLLDDGLFPIYVDLWSDPARTPEELIMGAIGAALHAQLDLFTKGVKAARISGVTLLGFLKVDYSRADPLDGLTPHQALAMIADKAKRPVVLIIDEAQHALTTQRGTELMTALKSARDQLNAQFGPDDPGLFLVMSGSDQDKLARLVEGGSAPFQGGKITRMPTLGEAFIEHTANQLDREYHLNVDRAKIRAAFELGNRRPEFFLAALDEAFNPTSNSSDDLAFDDRLVAAAQEQRAKDEAQMQSEYLGLDPLEQVILWRILEKGSAFRPTDADSLAFYKAKLGRVETSSNVVRAIERLRNQDPRQIWKSWRNEYAADDASRQLWYASLRDAGAWPPPGAVDAEAGRRPGATGSF